jgi:tryptophanyl-tRNA synthetase
MTQTIFSGIQPTGNLHLGNYLGAIKQWQKFAHNPNNNCFFCIVDLHAITIRQNSKELKENIIKTAALYLACDLVSEQNSIFVQSSIPQHAELAWLLSCNSPIGWLDRMTQFKEKSATQKEKASLGLYSYPVLMAADILLYNTNLVPVGEDQKQHIELARDIAKKFNTDFDAKIFIIPEPYIMGDATRVMSLRDGTKKMSKSDESDYSRINLLDDPKTILDKLKKAKSDSIEGFHETEERPEATNLLKIYATLKGISFQQTVEQFKNERFSKLKEFLAEEIIKELTPIQQNYQKIMNNRHLIETTLSKGEKLAQKTAQKTLEKAKQAMGLGV